MVFNWKAITFTRHLNKVLDSWYARKVMIHEVLGTMRKQLDFFSPIRDIIVYIISVEALLQWTYDLKL